MSILIKKHPTVENPPTTSEKRTTSRHGMIVKKGLLFLLPVLVGIILWYIPALQGVKPVAWHLLAIFIATIVGIIAKPLPMGAVALIGMTMTVLPVTDALSGFSNSTIWLIVLAFFIARGFIKTGLGQRIGYLFVALVGKRTLGLSYGLIASDLVLAPAIPSNTARSGGVVYPIMKAVAHAYGSDPHDGTARKLGAFLTTAIFQGTVITSAMFLTAMAANPLAAKLAADLKVQISWGQWALAALVPGLVSLIVIPLVLYKLYPPEIKETPNATQFAKEKLAEMGRMARNEWLMLGTFVLLLVLWIFGDALKINATTAALVGLGVLLVANVLTWDDIRKEEGAWDTLVWFSALVMMATTLNTLGLIPSLVEQSCGGGRRRAELDGSLCHSCAGLHLQPLPVRQQYGPRERHVRRISGGSTGRWHPSAPGRAGARLCQQPFRQYDPLRNWPRTSALRFRLRRCRNMVEARSGVEYRQPSHLGCSWRHLVEGARSLLVL
jgi:DASS family divalent anion:Na+ symporter